MNRDALLELAIRSRVVVAVPDPGVAAGAHAVEVTVVAACLPALPLGTGGGGG